MKTKVSLRLNEGNPSETVVFANSIVQHMTNNTNFSTPSPALATITAKATETEHAIADASNGGTELTIIRNQKLVELQTLIIAEGYYVEVIANGNGSDNGNPAIVLSAGIEIKKTKTSAGVPNAPSGIIISKMETKGNVLIEWDATKNARLYILQRNDDPNLAANAWKQVKAQTQTSTEVDSINLANPSAFRVCAVGTAVEGNYCPEVLSPDW